MKYFVRTTGERVLDESFSQIDYELLIDYNHNNIKAFISQIKQLSELNEDVVLLEDDIVLCRDFKSRIEKVISEHPKNVINFFYEPNRYVENIYCPDFIWNQCVYYPKEIIKLLKDNIQLFEYNNTKHHDRIQGQIFRINNIKFLIYRPCLVQHLSFDTLIHDRVYIIRTPYFVDYLDELGITYEEAKSIENTNKLREYMKEWFKKYEESYRIHTS